MQKLIFQVEFKSDIVLPASSNTEGNISQLDFIPGSNFLGMVAKNYDKFSNSFDVFHSGKVRFGDATLLLDEEELYKMPLSFFNPKLNENKIFHHHYYSDLFTEEERKDIGQLKQMRSGYIYADVSNGLKVKYINYNYAQKSAYDSTKRRSKTSSMYGYRAIEAGTKWQFVVKYDECISEEDIKRISETLVDSKRLGKSKSAEYGQIDIAYIKEQESIPLNTPKSGEEVILYAKSRIALVDKDGNPTYDLNYLLDDIEVDYPKCQIRTSTFTPYNGAMQTKTYERLVIEKGSVIVLESLSDEQKKELEKGVGLYLAEGFGELLVNPPFLMQKEELILSKKKKESNKKDQKEYLKPDSTYNTVNFLINRHNSERKKLDLADEVAKFIKDNKSTLGKKMNAQWGTVRSLTIQATQIKDVKALKKKLSDADVLEQLLFDDGKEENLEGFLMSKRAKDKWDSDLIKNIKMLRELCCEKELDYIQFIRLLAMDAPKQKEEKK
jgi:hypothetical protein